MPRKSRKKRIIEIPRVSESEMPIERMATAIYARLSFENNGLADDESIETQVTLLKEFVSIHSEYELVETYIDNGFTGTNFDRPEFRRMISDATCGKISCIIVKDLSRFGRNYIETGMYIETIFPKLNIRLIAVNDHFDSFNEEDRTSITIPMKNMINEMYSRDQSRKLLLANKIRRNKEDALPSGVPPYGYIRNSRKTRYLVRRDCGDYVKLIFLWTVIGVDGGEIARRLALLGAPVPSEGTPSKGGGKWTSGCVRRILNNPAYQGDVCMGKSSQRFGGNGYVYQKNHKADWTIHERRHEPLVTRIDQEMVFEMIRANARRNRVDQHKDVAGCFKGILYCKECDRPLITITDRSNEPRFTNSAFVKHCCNPVPYYSKHCNNFVSDDFLKYVVMESIKHHIKLVTDKKDIIQIAKESGNGKDLALSIDKKITSATSFLADEREKQLKLYEDYQTGVVDKDDFNILNRKCSERISLLQDKLKELQIKKNEYLRAINSYLTMIGDLKIEGDEYGFDPKLVKKLVARIAITRDKRIEITYKDNDIDQMINKALEGLV